MNIYLSICFEGGGTIDFGELKTVLISCMDESSLQLTDENLEDLTRALFESADEDNSGSITFEELVTELQKFPGVLENLTIRYSDVSQGRSGIYNQGCTIMETLSLLSIIPKQTNGAIVHNYP